ncbi:MAG: hypothetical protein AB1491_08500 [Thermodesulfobacteriota bacterium]
MRTKRKTWFFLSIILLLSLSSVTWAAEKGFLWNGTHWKDLTPEIRVAYVKGIGNMADFEVGMGTGGRAGCISQAFVNELKTKTIAQIIQEVDKYYKDNPKKMATPVIEVIMRRCTALCPPETATKAK